MPLIWMLSPTSYSSRCFKFHDAKVSQLSTCSFIQSEPKEDFSPSLTPLNIVIQSTSIDLLQALIVRGEVDVIGLQTIESVIIGKLYYAVHNQRLDVQNKALHLLHSIISGLNAQIDGPPTKSLKGSSEAAGDSSKQSESTMAERPTYSINPLLIQTLVDGVSVRTNRPVLQHWLDFILMTLPQFPTMLHGVVIPLNNCICRLLRAGLSDILLASSRGDQSADVVTFTTDADFIMLLNALERMVLLSLSQISAYSQDDDETTVSEKPESGGLLGYVSGVFSSDSAANAAEDQTSVIVSLLLP